MENTTDTGNIANSERCINVHLIEKRFENSLIRLKDFGPIVTEQLSHLLNGSVESLKITGLACIGVAYASASFHWKDGKIEMELGEKIDLPEDQEVKSWANDPAVENISPGGLNTSLKNVIPHTLLETLKDSGRLVVEFGSDGEWKDVQREVIQIKLDPNDSNPDQTVNNLLQDLQSPSTLLPLSDEAKLELELQEKGKVAPRLTPSDIESQILSEHYMQGSDIVKSDEMVHSDSLESLGRMTICILVLRCGFSVIGESSCVSTANFDAEIGKRIARQNALDKVWLLEDYALRKHLHNLPQMISITPDSSSTEEVKEAMAKPHYPRGYNPNFTHIDG